MRAPDGIRITLSPYRKPSLECMPVNAKAGCLYPNNARALTEARSRGFDQLCGVRHARQRGELATANVFVGKDGVVHTPAPNGTFLNGINPPACDRVIARERRHCDREHAQYDDLEAADEIFSSGNYSKVTPVIRIGERSLQPGPLYRKARALYWEFAHA